MTDLVQVHVVYACGHWIIGYAQTGEEWATVAVEEECLGCRGILAPGEPIRNGAGRLVRQGEDQFWTAVD